ncbi:putative bifunctional diguanylate cyclase/phosphodiesterase [Massilia endophytica]|uniref:putative bifunctional diguanylate cyclase/phosphodiesterase n=1 Tax=Massilia endophytica TaxID=2899220 RepID=UPI001E513613|nr:EAL domain-containing protein [Massilia endophytica]UGQ49005.1 EAL domain-containing protein [Massilia endophytica]
MTRPLKLGKLPVQTPKVLLVNDDPAGLFALESLLADEAVRLGYQLVAAGSGAEALREVLKQEFAVIVLDINMPDMDGFAAAEAIHSHPRSSNVPIIFVTAHQADEINRLRAYQAGAADYLFTPIIPQILQTKVAVFVEIMKQNMLLREQAAELRKLNQDLRVQRLQDLERANRELQLEIAERKLAEQRANALSTRDPLTGLVNRRSLIQQLEHAVATAERHHTHFALLFLDLDKFKQINDSFGHEVGDELLRQVAARITSSVRMADVVARLGGDEFVVLIEGKTPAANAARVARKIAQAHARPFDIGGRGIYTSTSIGIALYPQDGGNARLMMKNADLAMYHAKQERDVAGGGVRFFHEELNRREKEHEQWTTELRHALIGNQLELLYQPQTGLAGGRLCAVEAQLVWNHPRLGRVEAERFLPCIYDRSLLERLDAWTIVTACAQAAAWRSAPCGLEEASVAINLCSPQLCTETPAKLVAEVRRHRLPPGAMTLELNEALLSAHHNTLEPLLRQLQAAGVALALDSFGHARSSLAACKKLGLDQMKIDRAFVRNIGDDDGGTDMVAAIIHLARALQMRVVALGVDSQLQLAVLNTLGCDSCQGEFFCPPLAAAELMQRLEEPALTT